MYHMLQMKQFLQSKLTTSLRTPHSELFMLPVRVRTSIHFSVCACQCMLKFASLCACQYVCELNVLIVAGVLAES